jgi:hypothetical protein
LQFSLTLFTCIIYFHHLIYFILLSLLVQYYLKSPVGYSKSIATDRIGYFQDLGTDVAPLTTYLWLSVVPKHRTLMDDTLGICLLLFVQKLCYCFAGNPVIKGCTYLKLHLIFNSCNSFMLSAEEWWVCHVFVVVVLGKVAKWHKWQL